MASQQEAPPHVVVVGAGVIGCAVAASLSPAVSVTVLERDQIGSGATGRSAGEVTMTPVYSDIPAIAEYATAFFRQHSVAGADTGGQSAGFVFHERDSVEFIPPDRVGEATRRAERLADAGLDTTFLSRVDAATSYPIFDLGGFPGLLRHGDVGFVDPGQFVQFLATRAQRRGAEFRSATEVSGLVVDSEGRVSAVQTDEGSIKADVVVVAAGWRTPSLLADHVTLPVRPYRTQAAVIDLPSLRNWGGDLPMGWVPERQVYFRPMGGGRVFVGGFAEAIDEPTAASRDADQAFRRHVAEVVPDLFVDADGAQLLDSWAGIDLATPDTRPIIDAPADGPGRLVVATGFHGRGVMTAPVAGTAVRTSILGERAPFPLEPFALDRFEDRDPEFPFFSTSSGMER